MKRIINLLMTLTVCLSIHAALPDSLLSISKAYAYNYTSLDKSLEIIHELRERGDIPDWELLYAEGDIYRNICKYHAAVDCFQKALATSEVKRNIRLQMKVWRGMMNCHDMLMDDIMLMDDLYKLRKCATQCGDIGHRAIAYFVMGKRYHQQGKKAKGYEFCLDALEDLKKSDITKKMYALRTCYGVMVKLYRSDHLYNKAMVMSQLQEKYVRMASPDDIPGERDINLHNVYAQRASVLAEAGRMAEAEEAYLEWKKFVQVNPYDNREILSYLLTTNRLEEALNVINKYKAFLNAEGDSINIRMLDVLTLESHAYSLLDDYERAAMNNAPMASIAYLLHQESSRKEMEARYQSLQNYDQLRDRNAWLVAISLILLAILIAIFVVRWYRHHAQQQGMTLTKAVNRVSAYQNTAIKDDVIDERHEQAVSEEPESSPEKPSEPAVVPPPPSASQRKESEEPDENELLFVKLDKLVTRDKLFLNPDLSREDLMRLIGVDKNRIGRIMSRYSNTSNLSTYVNQKRAYYAADYIKKHPDYTIAAVMEACGMTNAVTLNRAFKDIYGMTPSEYRQRIVAGEVVEEIKK